MNNLISPNDATWMVIPNCPRCRKRHVRQCFKLTGWERFWSLLYFSPFRCQLCAYRFLAFGQHRSHAKRLEDLREYERIEVKFRVAFSGSVLQGEGETTDLTIKGCGFKTDKRLSKAMSLRLKVFFDEQEPPLEIESAIVRYILGPKAGLEFLAMPAGEAARLGRLIETLLTSNLPPVQSLKPSVDKTPK